MRQKRKPILKYILLIMILILVFLPYEKLFSKAEETVSAEENTLEASLQAELTGNTLIENSIQVENIDSNDLVENEIIDDSSSSNVVKNETGENTISNNSVQNEITKNVTSNSLIENIVTQNAASTPTVLSETLSEETTNYSLKAVLYDTNQYSSGTGTELTEDGAQVDSWQYETSKYLQIDPNVPADGNTYIITVQLPQEFYIDVSELTTPAGYQNVEFTKNESIQINEDLIYEVNSYSGTAKFTMNNMGTSGTIQFAVKYDTTLWNKMENSSLTPENVTPISVTLSKQDGLGQVTELKNVSISKATSNEKISMGSLVYTFINGNSYNSSVSILSDEKCSIISNISIGIVEGRYLYYPQMTLTIELPYYIDSDENKYYLIPNTNELVTNISGEKFIQYSSYEIDTTRIRFRWCVKNYFK